MDYESKSQTANFFRNMVLTHRRARLLIAATFALMFVTGVTLAQTSTFTYQGRFTDGGTAANGTYDMQFKLFDGAGNQIGSTITNGAVTVASGVFTVQLDYGAAAFPGADRFLEIGLRPAGSGETYTVLAPRQPLTSTPYAIRSATADTATNAMQLNGTTSDQFVLSTDSRLSDSRPPTPNASSYIQNSNSQQAANFNIGGNGTAAGMLSASVVNAASQYNINGERVLSTPGINNTMAGRFSGSGGQNNSFFGTQAGNSTTGLANSFFGSFAGAHNGLGSSNSFFGYSAGANNTIGKSNSFFGSASGVGNITGSDNAFFGNQAGFDNQSGSGNSYFGSGAGFKNVSSGNNSFFGFNAGRLTTSGKNSFFGSGAGAANLGGDSNTFVGSETGLSNTTGKSNTFVGADAGSSNKTGNFNSFFGYTAGFTNTSGFANSFFGEKAGYYNAGGFSNSFFGSFSGYGNKTGKENSVVGLFAGYSNNGDSNSFYGSYAGYSNTEGNFNAFFGTHAGSQNKVGTKNVFLGGAAGDKNETGSNNTVIGFAADVSTTNLNFATAIGSGAVATSSNSIVLGRSDASDAVRIPGSLSLGVLGLAGITPVCRNAFNQISTCSSSLRYKANIQPFIGGLEVVNRLRPITFDWKQGGMPDVGFGAEEVAAIEPLLVTFDDKGVIEGVKYDRINVALVNAVKEQQEQIRRQQTEIDNLKSLVCRRHQQAAVCR